MKDTQAIKQIWQHIYTSGVGDTSMGLIIISYFFILKGLEERSFQLGAQDTLFADVQAEACHWSMIKQMAYGDPDECSQHLRTNVAAWLRSLDQEACLADADQAFVRILPNILYRLMDAVDAFCKEYPSTLDAFEAVLTWAEKEGAFQPKAGQIMTPMHIAYLMADLVRPQPDERVIDASCGTGNLLVAAWQHMQRLSAFASCFFDTGRVVFDHRGQLPPAPTLFGYDFNSMMLPPCYTHLLLGGVDRPHVRCSDALGSVFNQRITNQEWGHIDVVLGNSPFGRYGDEPDLGETLHQVGTLDAELLFVEVTLQLLREGGRAALLVPEGVVRNSSQAAVALRKKLVKEHQLLAIVSLPQGIFLPQSNVKTTLLLFHKGGYTGDDVLFYRVSADGFSFDSRRQATPAKNDLWDVRTQYAIATGQTSPVPELMDPGWWAQNASQNQDAGTRFFVPSIEEVYVDPITGDRVQPFRQITGFVTVEGMQKRFRLVPIKEIEASEDYSLCVNTYWQDQSDRRHPAMARRRTGSINGEQFGRECVS